MKKIFIAVIGVGRYEDYREEHIFCSPNKEMVENWVRKFNLIMGAYKKWAEPRLYERIDVFLHEYVRDDARAFMEGVPIRK